MMFSQIGKHKSAQSNRVVVWFAALLFTAAGIASVMAQAPTQSQLDIYKNLSPEQQKAVLDSLGRGGASAKSDRPLDFPQTVRPRGTDAVTDDADLRLKSGDTLIMYLEIRKYEGREPRATPQAIGPTGVPIAPPPETRASVTFAADRIEELNRIRERIQRRNPFTLDAFGALNLPESGPIPLAGLTIEEAQERLSVNEQLKDFKITVTRLPVQPQGAAALKPFGYDLFAGSPSTFAPATDVPVPADYVVGPGDEIQVQLIGNTKGNHGLVVDREGKINFPDLGPVSVGGMRFEAMRSAIERRVREQMIGTQASVTMGELRSIRIFVLGEAERPGSYTVSGLSTMTNALFVSGGVKQIGSLRNIELKRNGQTITHLDLYDLLLKGDTRGDARLLPGDVIFITPVGATIGVSGEVRRPAIYELNGETTAKEIIALAGGLTAQADPALATMERIDERRQRVTMDINLSVETGLNAAVRSSDVLRVPTIRPSLEQSVSLNGYVYRPGEFQYRAGMRLSDLIASVDELRPNADQHYVLIRRESPVNRAISIFSADLAKALAARGSAADIELASRDKVYVFDLESGRDSVVEPLMRELRMQSNVDEPTAQVRVSGKVKVPGRYPLEPGMRVSDLIRAGGSLDESAYEDDAELTRYAVVNSQQRQTDLIAIDLKRIRAGDAAANIELKPFDNLLIKEVPLWAQQETVELRGEVRFPGKYTIFRGETLRSVLQRAGGFTDLAYPKGAIFTRIDLREREQKQIESLTVRMQSELAQLSVQAAQETGKDAAQALASSQSLLASLRATQPVGRLVIDLPRAATAKAGSSQDIVLKNGDLLLVPRLPQEVTVLGEVQSETSHLYRPSLSRDDYIEMSGGLTQRADGKRIYIVKVDGSVESKKGNSWFRGSASQISPGDSVVVPLDTKKLRPMLPVWQAVATIVSSLAITAAALHSL